jgi:tetratricopeptide (TPR) repeat protein
MTASGQPATAESRLGRLMNFLERDPNNLQLLGDTASVALDEGALDEAWNLLGRYAALSPLPEPLLNLKGLVALNSGRFDEAAAAFEGLFASGQNDPSVRLNLVWSKSLAGNHEGALAQLDDALVGTSSQAATLKIQTLHHLGRLEDALACGLGFAELYPHDTALMGALAVAAIDAEEIALARTYALRAGRSHDGLSTLGMLQLNEDHVDVAIKLFDDALATSPTSARALLGKGLGLLAKGDPGDAARYIDRGAEIFKSHLGSWVAAGWAHFVQGDYKASRARFEAALALDDTFSETHGGLAVLDIVEGKVDSAKRRTDVALRLDRKCFSGALAKVLILTSEGDVDTAERIRNVALNMPIGGGGRTIIQVMAGLGMANPKYPRPS